MKTKLKRATKRIPQWVTEAVRGGVYAVEVQPTVYAYFYVIHEAVGIYPVASQNAKLPLSLFSPKTWRWLRWPWMCFPQNAQFLGRFEELTDDDVTEPEYYEHELNTLGGANAFRIRRRGKGYELVDAIDCLEVPKYIRSFDLAADMLTLLPQMMVIDGNLFPADVKSKR
ncbi:hypothetical protein [Prosthecobacter sp.]|uniref:hypothetical protein n=1 Tax=Prosthecobacter sp. TaxID=1965333 RepID=UPI001DAC8F4E|nr:hypothetical protein [Prosthecobacter sp.]MCB1279547.1 hypothetical protein [Prosthecobacter sp.]